MGGWNTYQWGGGDLKALGRDSSSGQVCTLPGFWVMVQVIEHFLI